MRVREREYRSRYDWLWVLSKALGVLSLLPAIKAVMVALSNAPRHQVTIFAVLAIVSVLASIVGSLLVRKFENSDSGWKLVSDSAVPNTKTTKDGVQDG